MVDATPLRPELATFFDSGHGVSFPEQDKAGLVLLPEVTGPNARPLKPFALPAISTLRPYLRQPVQSSPAVQEGVPA